MREGAPHLPGPLFTSSLPLDRFAIECHTVPILLAGAARALTRPRYSHSIVPGGFEVTSSTTRFTSGTWFVIRFEMRASTS